MQTLPRKDWKAYLEEWILSIVLCALQNKESIPRLLRSYKTDSSLSVAALWEWLHGGSRERMDFLDLKDQMLDRAIDEFYTSQEQVKKILTSKPNE